MFPCSTDRGVAPGLNKGGRKRESEEKQKEECTYASHEMLLEIELAGRRAVSLNRLEDLDNEK